MLNFFKSSGNSINVNDIDSLVGKAKIIDIREPYEYNEGSIKTSENIPMSNLISTPEDYLDKNDKYYIVCKSGNRSGKLCNILGAEGYNVVNLAGGMMAYKGKNRV